jgi:hypothetical protein
MAAQADFEAIDFPYANRLTIRQFGGWPYLSSMARVVWAPHDPPAAYASRMVLLHPAKLASSWLACLYREGGREI